MVYDRDIRIAELEALVADLREQISVLMERLDSSSRSSSRPPSSDGSGTRAERREAARLARKASKRSAGGQPGQEPRQREALDGTRSMRSLRPALPSRSVPVGVLGSMMVTPCIRSRSVIRGHVGCYLETRDAVFAEQLGMAETVFYPTHGGIDENPYGLALRNPTTATARIEAITSGADQWPRRPFWLYLLTVAAMVFVWVRRRREPMGTLCLALGLGAFGYVASLYFLAPAADARYIFPSNVFCSLAVVIAVPATRTPQDSRVDPIKDES